MMINAGKISLEYRVAAVSGAGSFLLSFVLGFLAGNNALSVIIKSLVLAAVFIIVGFGSLYVLKKYVPEFYEIFSSIGSGRDDDFQKAEQTFGASEETRLSSDERSVKGKAGIAADKYMPADENDKTESALREMDDVTAQFGKKEQENQFKYEPEIAAQAIRTMMKKDEK